MKRNYTPEILKSYITVKTENYKKIEIDEWKIEFFSMRYIGDEKLYSTVINYTMFKVATSFENALIYICDYLNEPELYYFYPIEIK